MAYSTRSYARSYSDSGAVPPGVKWLLIVNIVLFVIYFFAGPSDLGRFMTFHFALIPSATVELFFFWQLATYMFLHGGISHILWNMLSLWMFGSELERTWGTRRFLQFYFFSGIGAGLCVVIGNYLFGNPAVPTVGSSGAIYGLLMAYAVLFPDRQILLGFLFPIKVKYAVMIFGAIAFLGTFGSVNSNVSNVAHLGGMLFGYIFLKMPKITGFDPAPAFAARYREWKIRRAKKKFQVYLRKNGTTTRDRDDDRFVN